MRGQAYTLEAVIASVLLVSSLVFALQVTAVTPLSASTSNQHIENQQRASASGVLTAAQEAGALKDAVLYWNTSGDGKYYEAEQLTYYTNNYPPNEFGNITARAFDGRGLAVNVLIYYNESEDPNRMVYRGEPSDNAVSASRIVTIYDDDKLTAPPNNQTTVADAEFEEVVPPDSGGNSVYNVVRVEVTVWRM